MLMTRSRSRSGAGPMLAMSALCCTIMASCAPRPLRNDPNAHVPLASAPDWQNWTVDVRYNPPVPKTNYYFSPTSQAELRQVLAQRPPGATVRVSGQRHAQPPLVIRDFRTPPSDLPAPAHILVDLSCYADLGPSGREQIVLDSARRQVTVNTGVREDYLDAFLTRNNLMLKTVTAGGFFSVGGMTAVDVHGSTVEAPIFAETAVAFTIMDAEGKVTTVSAASERVGAWSPLQFARVSLGALGVVTSVTLEVQERPYANSLELHHESYSLGDEASFVRTFKDLLQKHARLETFYNPYNNQFLVLTGDVVAAPAKPAKNKAPEVASSCTYAENGLFGAPYEPPVAEWLAEGTAGYIQYKGAAWEAQAFVAVAMDVIQSQSRDAEQRHAALWLQAAARVAFMSYFVELPDRAEAGLGKVWQGLQAVREANQDRRYGFLLAGPLEFRFVRGGDSALSATYSTRPDSLFVNLDLIGFVDPGKPARYPDELLDFFAAIERRWVQMGGFPHNGKMYGFYDPGTKDRAALRPFNPAFMEEMIRHRGERAAAFESYRFLRDPRGVFCNQYLRMLGLCGPSTTTPR